MSLVVEPPDEQQEDIDPSRLQVLLLDYEMAREDERSLISAQAAAFGVAVALGAGVTALTTQTCALQRGEEGCVDVPQALLAGVPIAPLAMLAFLQVLGTVATIRNYYLRAVENEIHRIVPVPLAGLPGVKPASYMELITTLTSMRRRGRLAFRVLNLLMLVALLIVFGGLTVYIAANLSVGFQVAMLVVYGSIGILLITEAMNATVGGRRMFVNLVQRYRTADEFREVTKAIRRESSDRPSRSLVSYLLLPRPEDCIKWLFVPATLGLALWSRGADGVDPVRALVVWGALEYLVYEARYQWNDLLGLADDLAHPKSHDRGRLPVGVTHVERVRNVALSVRVGFLRIAAAIGVAAVAGHDTLLPVLALTGLVFAVAAVYEWLRSRARTLNASQANVRAIWVVVGLGYAIRGATGLWLGGFALQDPLVLIAVPAFVAFGITFVTLTWVLEALSHCHGFPPRLLGYTEELERKPHLFWLLKAAEFSVEPGGDKHGPSCDTWAALEHRGEPWTPWNAGLIASAVLGGAIGVGLSMRGSIPEGPALLATLVAGAAAMVVVAARTTGQRGTGTVLGAVTLFVFGLLTDVREPALVAIPWLVFSGVFTGFRALSYAKLKAGPASLIKVTRLLQLRIFVAIIGRDTATAIGLRHTSGTNSTDAQGFQP